VGSEEPVDCGYLGEGGRYDDVPFCVDMRAGEFCPPDGVLDYWCIGAFESTEGGKRQLCGLERLDNELWVLFI
jgi:hypothetical protein